MQVQVLKLSQTFNPEKTGILYQALSLPKLTHRSVKEVYYVGESSRNSCSKRSSHMVQTHLHMTRDTIHPIDWIWFQYWPGT